MSKVRNEYEPLNINEINFPHYNKQDIPIVSVKTVENHLKRLKTNKATTINDIPPKILKLSAPHIAVPLTNLINSSIKDGTWPDIFKEEIVTPVPKTFPVKTVEDLRNISGLLTLDKVVEKIIGEMIIEDMKAKLDRIQYANQKGIGINHYLINMLNRVLEALDKNSKGEVKAVLATFVDWKQAFPRQCPKLGASAFIECGVRPALIPLLANYFVNRRMRIKWKQIYSTVRQLNGGGPQGALLGILEYIAQSNNNADMVEPEDRFKFVDDLTVLEIIDLLITEISTYNIKEHVPSDIPTHNKYIKKENLQSQTNLSLINNWTKAKKMRLNMKKTKVMIFNFTRNHQFTTRLQEEDTNIEVVSEIKLLGTWITNDLKWDINTDNLVKRAYARMRLLHNAARYTRSKTDLKSIYYTYIRPVLEQSATVWHSSLTQDNKDDLNRVQKSAVRVIMGGGDI